MKQYERIRRMVLVEGLSIREVSRRLKHSRKSVKKALVYSSPPGYRRKQERAKPVIDPVRSVIDAWMEEDQRRPRKQRHTGERIYQRLRDEYGYRGTAATVRRYVAWRRRYQGEVFFPLSFEVGEEAQVDWGEGWVIENGREGRCWKRNGKRCWRYLRWRLKRVGATRAGLHRWR